jgi:hypothetical protein
VSVENGGWGHLDLTHVGDARFHHLTTHKNQESYEQGSKAHMAALKKGLSVCGVDVFKPITGVPSHLLSPLDPDTTRAAVIEPHKGKSPLNALYDGTSRPPPTEAPANGAPKAKGRDNTQSQTVALMITCTVT